MTFRTVAIRWHDLLNKDINDPSAYTIVNNNYQVTSLPVQGLNIDYEVFVYESESIPPIDYRLFYLQINEGIIDEFSTEWTQNRIWRRTYSVVSRAKDEVKQSVDNEKYNANNTLFPIEKQIEYLAMYAAGVKRLVLNQSIPAALQDIFDKADAKIELIYQNHLLSLQKKAALDADNPIDIDDGWEETDPETI